jgi:hypothetical protein
MALTIEKLADETEKAYGRFVKQLRREGFAKKEQHYGNIPENELSSTAIALQRIYKAKQAELDKECVDASQPGLPIGEDWGDSARGQSVGNPQADEELERQRRIEEDAANMRETKGGKSEKPPKLKVAE